MDDINISEVINALKIIREVCENHEHCIDCPFYYPDICNIKHTDPEKWEFANTYMEGFQMNIMFNGLELIGAVFVIIYIFFR